MVKITFDGSEQAFYLQKHLLYNSSDYLARKIDDQANEGSITLPECDEDTFELFLFWLCNRRIPGALEELDCKADPDLYATAATEAQITLVKLWRFAELVSMPHLQDDAMRGLLACLKRSRVKAKALKVTLELTAPQSAVQRAMMDELIADIGHMFTDHPFPSESNSFTEDEMDTMGAITGLFGRLLSQILLGLYLTFKAATEREPEAYMVSAEQ